MRLRFLRLALVLACLARAAVASAQVENPIQVQFTCSADHATVTRYEVRAVVESTGNGTAVVSAGLPTPVGGLCTVAISTAGWEPGVAYRIQVRSVRGTAVSPWVATARTGVVPVGEAEPPPAGTNYYVATYGLDSRTCVEAQNIATPKLTIASGAACLTAGSALYVRAGTYTAAKNSVTPPSGTSWVAPVTLAAYPGETVTLKPHPFRTFNATLSYVVFKDFIFDGDGQGWIDGVSIGQGPHHLRFDGIEMKNYAANGFVVSTASNEVINCYLHDGGTDDFDNAVYVNGPGANNTLVRGTEITRWAGAGIQVYNGVSSVVMSGIVLWGNRIHHTSGGIRGTSNTVGGGGTNGGRSQGIIVQNASGTLVANNLIYRLRAGTTPRYGILAGPGSTNTRVFNNTIVNNPTEGLEVYLATNTALRNNITYGNSLANDIAGSGTVQSNNLTTNPLFVDSTTDDYHLQAGSAALGAGTPLGEVPTDFDGVTRGTPPDIGAFERP